MFNCIKKLFGEGYIYAEYTFTDGTRGHSRAPYIGDPETFDKDEYIAQLKQEMWFKHRRRIQLVDSLKIL